MQYEITRHIMQASVHSFWGADYDVDDAISQAEGEAEEFIASLDATEDVISITTQSLLCPVIGGDESLVFQHIVTVTYHGYPRTKKQS